MSTFLKKLFLGLGKALIALVIVLSLINGYVVYTEHSASKSADDFCKSISPGSETSPMLELAISRGADTHRTKWVQLNGKDQLTVTFTGATPLSRYICWVEAAQGRVISNHVVYLD